MIRVGVAGIGFMGMIHYLAYGTVKGAKVAAIATRDEKKLAGDWRSIRGNFGPAGTQMDLAGVKKYHDLDSLLADPAIDLVDLCLPPHLHADAAIAALKAGKHVLCEKPIALTAREARRMVGAADRAGKMLLVAHVLPFFPEFAYAYELASSGKYGRALSAHFKRIISDPLWLKDFFDPRRVGGPLVDLHIHDAHFIRLVWGMPRAVFTSGRQRGEVAEFFTSQFLFDDPQLAITATSGVIAQQGRSFTHGYEIQFERATLTYDFAVVDGQPQLNCPVTLFTSDGKATRVELGSSDPIDCFAGQLSEAVRAVRKGRPSKVLDGRLACDALLLCEKQDRSLRTRKLVSV